MMDSKSKNQSQFMRFDSIPDAINATAKDLSENYLTQGVSTIADIGAKYAPTDAKNDPKHTNEQWPSQVSQIYRKMGGSRERFAMGSQLVGPAVNLMVGYNEPSTGLVSNP